MQARPKVLAAVHPAGMPAIEAALGADAELVVALTVAAALELLREQPDIALVVCGAHFDESRMFDVVRGVRARRPDLAVVCCRLVPVELRRLRVELVRIAAEGLGAPFIDLPRMRRELGEVEAARRLREALISRLPVA